MVEEIHFMRELTLAAYFRELDNGNILKIKALSEIQRGDTNNVF